MTAPRGDESCGARSDSRRRFIAARPSEVFAAMSDSARIARWWGPRGFTSTIHEFEFRPDGKWLLTMHGLDGKDYPNESHFFLTIELAPKDGGTEVSWRQTFDTVAHYERMAGFVAAANEQNLDRLAAAVSRGTRAG